MRQRSLAWTFTAMATSAVLALGTIGKAGAGAPNYECDAGPYRLAIDQHRERVLLRNDSAGVHIVPIVASEQDGPALDLTAGPLSIRVRGLGEQLTVRHGDRSHHGRCAFVPGNFMATTPVASQRNVLAEARPAAPIVARLATNAILWVESYGPPTRTSSGRWRAARIIGQLREGSMGTIGAGTAAGLDQGSSIVSGWVPNA